MRPIGIFDSGYGGLTVFKAIAKQLPQYDYIYLGDNARAPYGNRSFETVYEYTLEAVQWLFSKGCPLVILACNTASAKALRSIQTIDLPRITNYKRVLGVIRPSAEVIGNYTKTGNIGILGTKGTVSSNSYVVEIGKFFPNVNVFQHACPLWVPFIENGNYMDDGIDYYIQKDLEALFEQNSEIDTILLACTHYPLLTPKIEKYLPPNITLVSQGDLVAESLTDYLQRHTEIEQKITAGKSRHFFTTDDPEDFEDHAATFFGKAIHVDHIHLEGRG